MTRTRVQLVDAPPTGNFVHTFILPGGHDLWLPADDVVDVEKECAKLVKELAQVDGQLASARARLANEKFVASAPAHVVDGARKSERELGERREQLARKIATLCRS